MPMYNLIEHNDNYSNTSWSLWHNNRDESSLTDAGPIGNLLVLIIDSKLFKLFKYK